MRAARAPRADKTKVKLLVVKDGWIEDGSIERLPDHLRSGDLLAVNDAATLPASLPARDAKVAELTTALTANVVGAVRETKRLLQSARAEGLETQRRLEREAQARRLRELAALTTQE